MVQLGGVHGTIQGVSSTHLAFSVHFVWSVSGNFFSYPLGVSGVWEPRQGVRCILRTVSPPPKKILCPGLALLVVHVADPFRQISGMKVVEGMEGHGTKCECPLSVLLGCRRGV